MNHTVVTYLGFVVAILIITWAAVELGRRFQRRGKSGRWQKRANAATNQWITLKPNGPPVDTSLLSDDEGAEGGSSVPDAHTRARQNGHSQNGHSQSKYPL